VPGPGASHGLIDDVLGHHDQFGVLGLADGTQPGERLCGGATGTSEQDADGLVDDGSAGQRCLQLLGLRRCFVQDVSVVRGNGGGGGKLFAQFDGAVGERALGVGVNVDGADKLIREQQRQGQHAVYAKPAHSRAEAWP
jgi:hypothetical protein